MVAPQPQLSAALKRLQKKLKQVSAFEGRVAEKLIKVDLVRKDLAREEQVLADL